MDQHKIHWNARKIKVPTEYVMVENRTVNITLRQDSEGVLMSLSRDAKLPFIFPGVMN